MSGGGGGSVITWKQIRAYCLQQGGKDPSPVEIALVLTDPIKGTTSITLWAYKDVPRPSSDSVLTALDDATCVSIFTKWRQSQYADRMAQLPMSDPSLRLLQMGFAALGKELGVTDTRAAELFQTVYNAWAAEQASLGR